MGRRRRRRNGRLRNNCPNVTQPSWRSRRTRVPNLITGSDVTYAAGGHGQPGGPASNGADNTGNGADSGGQAVARSGGPGIVVVRFPADAAGFVSVAPGTNTVSTLGPGEVVAKFTVSGTLTLDKNMAHFAELDENNVVKRVVVIGNDVPTADGPLGDNDMHPDGEAYCNKLFGGTWKQTRTVIVLEKNMQVLEIFMIL